MECLIKTFILIVFWALIGGLSFFRCTDINEGTSISDRFNDTTYSLKQFPQGLKIHTRIFNSDTLDKRSILVVRIGKNQCERCINEFVEPIIMLAQPVPKINVLFLVSTQVPNDILAFKKKYEAYGAVEEFPLVLPLDHLGVPYLFQVNSSGFAHSHGVYGVNTKDEIISKTMKVPELFTRTINHKGLSFVDTIATIPIVEKGREYSVLFKYKNLSFADMKISKVETGCGCTVAKWDSNYVAAGANGEIIFKIKSSNSGAFYRECSVFEEGSPLPITLIIKSKF